MQLVYSLRDAADLFSHAGDSYTADGYRKLASSLTIAVRRLCWDEKKQLLSDTPDKNSFSQHANIFGVLTDVIPQAKQKSVIRKTSTDTSLVQASVYFRFYLGQAYKKAGLSDEYGSLLEPWKKMLEEGLTTFAEVPGHARSDCHPWSCSPLYEFYASICGIHPMAPGFSSIEIAPTLGKLKWIRASMAHRGQALSLDLKRTGAFGIDGEIILPTGIKAIFKWNGQVHLLNAGKNTLHIK
jgi:hypothetical protein